MKNYVTPPSLAAERFYGKTNQYFNPHFGHQQVRQWMRAFYLFVI
jgi:hypothetical protein